jgi:hypothetical protein
LLSGFDRSSGAAKVVGDLPFDGPRPPLNPFIESGRWFRWNKGQLCPLSRRPCRAPRTAAKSPPNGYSAMQQMAAMAGRAKALNKCLDFE